MVDYRVFSFIFRGQANIKDYIDTYSYRSDHISFDVEDGKEGVKSLQLIFNRNLAKYLWIYYNELNRLVK